MIRLYIIGLVFLVALVAGLVFYIFLRRAYLIFSEWDERRRSRYWKPIIHQWLHHPSDELDNEFSSFISSKDQNIIIKLCIENINIKDSSIRAKLIQWLRESGYVTECINKVNSSDRWERAKAIETLGALKVTEAEPILISALEDPVFDVRIRAAKALGNIGGKPARHALISALGDEGRWSVIRIADILGQMGPSVVNDLIEAFPSLKPAPKLAALDIIIRLVNSSHLQFLLSCLSDGNLEIRTRAVTGLGRIGTATALPLLLYSLHDREWPVRAKSAKALGDLGLNHAIPGLIDCLSDKEWWVRYSAAEALSKLGDAGTDALINCLSSSDPFCRDQAFSILQSTGIISARLEEVVSKNSEATARAQNLAAKLVEHLSLQGFIDFCEGIPNIEIRSALWSMYQKYSKHIGSAA